MKNIEEHSAVLKAIPKDKWTKKLRNTLVGLGAIAAAVVFKRYGWFPDWFLIGLLIFGGYSLAGDVVRGFAGFLPAAIKDIRAAIKNGK